MGREESYAPEVLANAVSDSHTWNELMRRLGLKPSGGQRRVLQQKVATLGLDVSHFRRHSPWRAYSDAAISSAVAGSVSLREVALHLGATPARGTLSHLRRRIAAAGIDISHFTGFDRSSAVLSFTDEELRAATAASDSVRGAARALGVPDDGRSRAALGRLLRDRRIDTSHFRNARSAVPEDRLRAAVESAHSYADTMRALGMEVNYTNHRRVRRKVAELGLDTSHFTRRSGSVPPGRTKRSRALDALVVLPPGSPRPTRERLHAGLREQGVPYRCTSCGNRGEWLGQPITLHIDHVDGNWLDNRVENLRYLCPNCHALTPTWCRKKTRHGGDPGPVH